jgi:plastocyanin
MKRFYSILISSGFCWMLLLAFLIVPKAANAQESWNANVGAESKDQAKQADAFLPNEIWVYAGDSITWKFAPKNEIHTVTFLTPGQVRPPFPAGCPGTTASGSSYNGSSCVNSGPLAGGATYTVQFPTAGNYKLVCLVHADMNGVVHVLPLSANLPHTQGFYDDQARDEARDLITDSDTPREERNDFPRSQNVVTMTGEVSATAGGRQYLSIVRFFPETVRIHVGEAVEWINADPTEPHTVTFGTEPANPQATVNANTAPDGALSGTLNSANASVSSGFLQAAPQDRIGLSQSSAGTTRIRITFTHPGTYNYICALHDVDGMKGKVVVLP